MERTLNKNTPPYVYDAVDALMHAETRRGPYRFLDDVGGMLPLIPDRSEIVFAREKYHPVDDAVELARYYAVEVEEEANARRWKAASTALRAVEDCQQMYWIRRHIETLRPIPSFILRGYVTLREPRIHVFLAEGDVHLVRLPPTSSQEAIEAAIDAWLEGCRQGAARAARLFRRTAAHIESAIQ